MKLSSQFIRFLFVGAFNTVSGYLVYWALLSVFAYRVAYSIPYVVGVFVSYLLNCRFVFERKPTWRGALRFPLVYVFQYLLGLVLLSVFVERLKWDQRLAAAAVICCSVPLTFVLSKFIIRPAVSRPSDEN
jgi:putative flippase GtrA